MPAPSKAALRGKAKTQTPPPPKTVIETLAPEAQLAASAFFCPQALPKKHLGRLAFAKGIERLARAPVFVARHHRGGRPESGPALCWTLSALPLAARLEFKDLRSLACHVGRLPEDSWAEKAAGPIHRLFRAADYSPRLVSPLGALWSDIMAIKGMKDPRQGWLRPNGSAGCRGWAARSVLEAGYGGEAWDEALASQIASQLSARRWGPVTGRAFAATSIGDQLVSAATFYRYSAPRQAIFAALRVEHEGVARAHWEADALRQAMSQAQSRPVGDQAGLSADNASTLPVRAAARI